MKDGKSTSIFRTIVDCGNEAQKLVIYKGNNLNVVSETTVLRLMLPTVHPEPYKVASIHSTSILITKWRLVSSSCSHYNDSIWWDVIPTTITYT